jgi:hypothetical protein
MPIISFQEPLLDAPRLRRLDVTLGLLRQPIKECVLQDVWQRGPFVGDVVSVVPNDVSAFAAQPTRAFAAGGRDLRMPDLLALSEIGPETVLARRLVSVSSMPTAISNTARSIADRRRSDATRAGP